MPKTLEGKISFEDAREAFAGVMRKQAQGFVHTAKGHGLMGPKLREYLKMLESYQESISPDRVRAAYAA